MKDFYKTVPFCKKRIKKEKRLAGKDVSLELGNSYDRLEVLVTNVHGLVSDETMLKGWLAVICDVQESLKGTGITLGYKDPEKKYHVSAR